MNSLCVSAFVRELGALVEQLKYEGHPALPRFLPFYSEDTQQQVCQNWKTLAGLRQVLNALKLSVRQLWYCSLPHDQQFGFQPASSVCSFETVQPTVPAKKRVRKDRPRKKNPALPQPPPLVASPEYTDVGPFAQAPRQEEPFDLYEFLITSLPTKGTAVAAAKLLTGSGKLTPTAT